MMALTSMTGFARVDGAQGAVRWTWELRSVNGKGLDLRLRLPAGFEEIEPSIRETASRLLKRGNVTVGLSSQREQGGAVLQINEAALEAVLEAIQLLQRRIPNAAPPSLDGILAHKGVLELREPEEDEAERAALLEALKRTFEQACTALVAMRRREGAALERVLTEHLDRIAELVRAAEDLPSRRPEAIAARLRTQVEALLETSSQLDAVRLHQEAALLATKVDIREELDRLTAHIAAARELLKDGNAVGRRLDFLAQEFNREANTLCSKSNDHGQTAIGLELKARIDQMREQIQNVE